MQYMLIAGILRLKSDFSNLLATARMKMSVSRRKGASLWSYSGWWGDRPFREEAVDSPGRTSPSPCCPVAARRWTACPREAGGPRDSKGGSGSVTLPCAPCGSPGDRRSVTKATFLMKCDQRRPAWAPGVAPPTVLSRSGGSF